MGRGLGKHFLFQGKICFQIDMGGLHGLVTEPESDDGGVDAGLQKLHGRSVPQDMRRYLLILQRRAVFGRRFDMLCQDILNPIITHSPALAIGKHGLSVTTCRFLQPSLQYGRGLLRQWRAAFLSAFAEDVDMGADPTLYISPGQPSKFRQA